MKYLLYYFYDWFSIRSIQIFVRFLIGLGFELKTSDQWFDEWLEHAKYDKAYDEKQLDPAGWDQSEYSEAFCSHLNIDFFWFYVPITKTEFDYRMGKSCFVARCASINNHAKSIEFKPVIKIYKTSDEWCKKYFGWHIYLTINKIGWNDVPDKYSGSWEYNGSYFWFYEPILFEDFLARLNKCKIGFNLFGSRSPYVHHKFQNPPETWYRSVYLKKGSPLIIKDFGFNEKFGDGALRKKYGDAEAKQKIWYEIPITYKQFLNRLSGCSQQGQRFTDVNSYRSPVMKTEEQNKLADLLGISADMIIS
jgi:hypothetical protein